MKTSKKFSKYLAFVMVGPDREFQYKCFNSKRQVFAAGDAAETYDDVYGYAVYELVAHRIAGPTRKGKRAKIQLNRNVLVAR